MGSAFLFTGPHLARRTIPVPGPVIAEVAYLLQTRGGLPSRHPSSAALAEGTLTHVNLDSARVTMIVSGLRLKLQTLVLRGVGVVLRCRRPSVKPNPH